MMVAFGPKLLIKALSKLFPEVAVKNEVDGAVYKAEQFGEVDQSRCPDGAILYPKAAFIDSVTDLKTKTNCVD